MTIIALQFFLADLWNHKPDGALGMFSKGSSRNNRGNVGKKSVAGYRRSFFCFKGRIRIPMQGNDNHGV